MADDAAVISVGRIEEFPVGRFCVVEIARREIGVVQLRPGEFRAVHNECPHKGAPICRGKFGGTWAPSAPGTLEFVMADQVLTCPWHGFQFDLDTGRELYWRQASRLRFYPVIVRDGEVLVTMRGES